MRSQKYGARNRNLVDATLKTQQAKYECAKCRKMRVKRTGYGVWQCRSCDSIFAGGAYSFSTKTGELAARFIAEYGSKG